MPAPANLCHMSSTTTGTGNLTVAAINGKQALGTAFGTGGTTNVFDYFISNRDAAEWERGTGHMSDATTLVRDTVIESTNSNAAVSFSAGTKDITNAIPATKQVYTGQNLIEGFTFTSLDQGTKSSGTFTPVMLTGQVQHFTNNGAHTLAPPTGHGSMILDQTNGASAGTITRSGFTKVTGDLLATTNALGYRHFISVGNEGSHCHTQAMQ